MSVEPELEITYINSKTMAPETLRGRKLEDQIDKLKRVLEYVLKKMQKIGDYEVSEFTAFAGIELGVWVLKADGSVSITWEKSD